MSSWIKLHRKILHSNMYKSLTSKQRDVLIVLLLSVNYKENSWEWEGEVFNCKPGQFVTSLDSIMKNCAKDVKVQSVRTALLKLEKWGFLTNMSTKTGRLISIVNWRTYQANEEEANKDDNEELTKDQQSPNKDLTSIKEGKEVKEGKEEDIRGADNVDNGTDMAIPGPGPNDSVHAGDNRGSMGDSGTISSGGGQAPMGPESAQLGQEEVADYDLRGLDGGYDIHGSGCGTFYRDHNRHDDGDKVVKKEEVGHDTLGPPEKDEAKPKPAKKKPKKKNGVVLDYSVLDPAIDEDVIRRFVEFRRVSKKKPVKTQETLEGIATAALTCRDVYGYDPNHCLLYTMQAGANGGWLLPKPEYFENEGISFKMWEKRLVVNLPKNQNKIKCKECANFGTCQNAEDDPIASCSLYTPQREMVDA